MVGTIDRVVDFSLTPKQRSCAGTDFNVLHLALKGCMIDSSCQIPIAKTDIKIIHIFLARAPGGSITITSSLQFY